MKTPVRVYRVLVLTDTFCRNIGALKAGQVLTLPESVFLFAADHVQFGVDTFYVDGADSNDFAIEAIW